MVFADLVLLEGKVLTMDPMQPEAEAVGIKGDRIIYVGSTRVISTLIGKDTKVVHLNGKTAIPGIIDTHIHVADYGRILSWLNLENVRSIEEMKECLVQRLKTTPEGKWIIGRGWDQTRFSENRCPNLNDLDKISPNNPVVLYHASGQVCAVNTKASQLAGILQKSPDDESNLVPEFTGILCGEATNLVWNVIPQPGEKDVLAYAALACQKIVEAGITSIHWMVLSPIEVGIIEKLRKQNELIPRATVIVPVNLLKEAPVMDHQENCSLKFSGAEIFADGYLAAETAALSEPYNDNPNERGKLLCSREEMAQTAAEIEHSGLQVIIHAVGDEAVDAALTVIEQAQKGSKGRAFRFRIEQAAVLSDELVGRLKKANVIVSIQPSVVSSEFSVWSALKRLGFKRASSLFPLKTLVKSRIFVVAGSDCPMEPLNPFVGIQAAVCREAFPEQRLSVLETLRMYTIDAAYASGDEKLKGSIEVGKLADITVLSEDLLTVSPSKIGLITAAATIIGGRVLYSSLN